MAISASEIVSARPGVISAGGTALDLIGLLLTSSPRVPIGSVLSFSSAPTVATYFGPTSPEATFASTYFLGFDNSTVKPGALLISQYPTAPVASYLRGGPITLAQAQAASPATLTLTIDGAPHTSSAINLAAVNSLSAAAAAIQAAFTGLGATVTYDSVSAGFVVTSATTGTTSSVSFGSGPIAASLMLTQATGALVSAGAPADTPAGAMAVVIGLTQDFATFTTLFEPNTADCEAFSAWANSQDDRYAYVLWDTDPTVATADATASAGAAIVTAGYSGTVLVYAPTNGAAMAAFIMGTAASVDYTATNGRTVFAGRGQSGLPPDITSTAIYDNVKANGYNCYGDFGTAAQEFIMLQPGSITGEFLWIDSFLNEIQLTNAFQLAGMELITTVGEIPFNTAGDGLIDGAFADTINQALDFGSIRAGVTLSSLQTTEINNLAGPGVAAIVSQRGWYLRPGASTATPQVRQARGPIQPLFLYADGQSVQTINITSLEVQ